MDIFVLKALTDELRPRLQGALVSKVFQMNADDLLLRLWRHQDMRLLLSCEARWPRLHLTTERFQNPQTPPRFAALLRARLQHVRLQDIQVHPEERRVTITWGDSASTAPTFSLIQVLQRAQSNLLLVDADGIIMDALKPSPDDKRHAPLRPGQPYQLPPLPPGRIAWSSLTVEHLAQLQQDGHLDVPHLQRLVIGLPRPLAAELVYRSQDDVQHAAALLQTLHQQEAQGTLSLQIHTTATGERSLNAFPLTYAAGTAVEFASPHEAVVAFYQPVTTTAHLTQRHSEVQRTATQRLQKLRRKMTNLQQDYHKLQSYLPYQHYGTLLLTQRLPRGASSASVVDYYHAEQTTVQIPLDPRLSVYDNAQTYFKKYRKAKNGLGTIEMLLAQCGEEEQQLEGLMQQAAEATYQQQLETIAAAVEEAFPRLRRRSSPPVASLPPRSAVPYRTFVLPEGYTLYCGKSDQGNEALLRQVATAEDIWLHAHQHAGAHVVLKVQAPQEVPDAILSTAAAVAAFYSKGKNGTSVEVLYTRAKHVRKLRGARPGQVQVREYRTIRVAPQLPGT